MATGMSVERGHDAPDLFKLPTKMCAKEFECFNSNSLRTPEVHFDNYILLIYLYYYRFYIISRVTFFRLSHTASLPNHAVLIIVAPRSQCSHARRHVHSIPVLTSG